METLTEAGADLSPPAFSQVVFIDVPQTYPCSAPITCRFTLKAALQPSSRDWVGIFKVGWSSTKDYHTFVWVEDPEGSQRITRQAVFKEYYLPKDEIEFYQFCYIDSVGQVRGASTPFCFRNQAEQNTGSLVDDELLVITTQDQVDQSQREKAEMQTELDLLRVENDTLRSALQKGQKEINISMEHDEQRVTEITKLNREMDQIKEHNNKLKQTLQQQLKENDRLKEKMATQQTEQEMLNQSLLSSKSNEDKYERVLTKINQLKEERDELRTKVDAQSDELTKLKAKLREQERELSKTNDRFQLLQVDYQSTYKEKEKLTVELQRLQSLICSIEVVKRENQELCRRLSQQETSPPSPQDDVKVQYQSVTWQLQETRAKLASEKEETRKARRQAEVFESELEDAKKQLKKVAEMCNQEKSINGKYEMQVKEMSGLMADKDILIEDNEKRVMLWTLEKNELVRENEKLKGEIEKLRVVYTSLGDLSTPAAASESMYLQPDDIGAPVRETSANQDQQRHQENIYETIDSIQPLQEEEPVLVCRHCQESFPGITENELEQHEQSHRVCPFCTMICDNMEQSVFEDHVYSHEL